MKKTKHEKEKEAILKIIKNYMYREKSFVNQLLIDITNHPPTIGSYREEVWKSLFEQMIPKKYCIEQGIFIIDSKGCISREVDLAIFDEMYTPYIFKYGKIKFIPIEAVAMVIQCKSKIKSKKVEESILEWVKSIDEFETSLNAVIRTITGFQDNLTEGALLSQSGTRPIKILCSTGISDASFKRIKDNFDFVLYLEGRRLCKKVLDEEKDFLEWDNALNHNVKQKEEITNGDEKEQMERERKTKKAKEIVKRENEKSKGWTFRKIKENEQLYLKENGEDESRLKNIMKRESRCRDDRTLKNLCVMDKNKEENVIMSLTFQLNQLLMLINNPMLFPHEAYVKMFNQFVEDNNIIFHKSTKK